MTEVRWFHDRYLCTAHPGVNPEQVEREERPTRGALKGQPVHVFRCPTCGAESKPILSPRRERDA